MGMVDDARAEGYTDAEIQTFLAPKVAEAQRVGYTPEEIAKHIGVKSVDEVSAQKNLANIVYDHLAKQAKTAVGVQEAGASVVSGLALGFPAYMMGGVGGLIARNTYSPDTDPKEIAKMFSEAVTYDSRSDQGKSIADTVTYPLQLLSKFKERMGEKVADETGSPALAAITDETIGMLPFVLTGGLVKSLRGKAPTPADMHAAASEIAGPNATPAEVIAVRKNVQELYEKTGIHPETLKDQALNNPAVKQDLLSSNKVPFADELKGDATIRAYQEEVLGAKDITGAERAGEKASAERRAAAQAQDPNAPVSVAAAEEAVLARVSVGEQTKPSFSLAGLYTAVKDDLYPLAKIEEQLAAGKDLTTAESPYDLARLVRGAAGKAQQFLDHGTFDWSTYKNTGPALKQILEPHKTDLDGFRAFAVAKRATELHARGIETGVPAMEAEVVVRQGGKYEKAFGELQDYQESLVKYLRDSGVISEDAYAAMLEANKDYVPFHRVMEGAKGGVGPGMSSRNPIRGIKGSERVIVDPLESIIKNTYLYTALAERNAVGQAFGKLVDANPEAAADLGVKVVKAKTKAIDVTAEELARAGIEGDGLTIFRPNAMRPGPNQIRYFDEGKAVTLDIPRDVADAFNATDRQSAGILLRTLAVPAKTLRAGSVLAPDFMLRNIVRDQLSAFAFSKNGYIPVWDMVSGAVSIVGKDASFQNWLKSGGANAAMVAIDRQYLQQHLVALDRDAGLMSRAWNVAKSPLEVLRITSELAENATRLGEFKRAMAGEEGKAAIQSAGFESREVTLDFQRIGAQTRGLNMISAFMNAGLEGIDRTARAFKDAPLATTAKVSAAITVPSILLWMANHDDPRYKEIPQWQRDLFWIVMTKDNVYRIPKPFEMGVIFGSVPERMLDKWAGDNSDAFKNFHKTLMSAFGANVMPTFAAPPLEQVTNHSFFTGNPVVPHRMEGLLPEYQYHEYSTELSKAVGHLVGAFPGLHDKSIASPMVIDNYVRGWTGSLGAYTEQLLDAGLRKAGVLPDPPQPISTLADIPVVKAFVVRYPSASAQSVQDFYEKYTERKKVYDTFQYLVKNGDPDAAMVEQKLAPNAFERMEGIHKSLSVINNAIRMVYRLPDMTPSDKRQLIDSMYGQMIEQARAGNQAMAETDKALRDQAPDTFYEIGGPTKVVGKEEGALRVPASIQAALPDVRVREYRDPRSAEAGYVEPRLDPNLIHVNMSSSSDHIGTLYHEADHLMAARARGSGRATNTVYDEMRSEAGGSGLPPRAELVSRLVAAGNYLSKTYGMNSGYFDPAMERFQGRLAPNLLAEQLATLSAIQQSKGVDIVNDPHLKKTVFTTPELREAVDAMMGLRQTRLDSKDLAPYTAMSNQPKWREPEPSTMVEKAKRRFAELMR